MSKLSQVIIKAVELENEIHTLAAQKYSRECSLLDFESRTAVDKQLQQSYALWPDYKSIVDKYDNAYAEHKKLSKTLDYIKTFSDKLTEVEIDSILDSILD